MRITVNGTPHQVDFVHHFAPAVVYRMGESGFTGCSLDVVPEPDGRRPFSAIATCSAKDMFRKATGRKVALTRALKAKGYHKAWRTAFWAAYFKQAKQ